MTILCNAIANGALPPSKSLSLGETQLVRCLTHISQRYFAPGRTVVISSPSNYRDVQQELIAEIQRISISPVVVTVGGNIGIHEESNFMDRDGNYIILMLVGNMKSLQAEINGLAFEGTKFTRLWNSEARFVVAGANEFSTLQQKDIFDYLSKFRVYNCIKVNKENDVINEENSRRVNINDVDMNMKLGVYTWFPYQSSDSCTEVNDITQLDSWVISAQGHFTKNTDLFPRKISRSLKGCPMKAVVSNDRFYTTYYNYVRNSNGSIVTEVSGMEMDLLIMVLKQLNMTFVHVPMPEDFEFKNGLTDNLSRAMTGKDVFIALGNLGTRILIDPFLESSNSHYTMTYRWYVPYSDKYSRWSNILRIFSLEVWVFLIISIVIAAISTTLVGRYSCTSEWQGYKTLSSSLTKLWAVILGVTVPKIPRTPSLRSLFLGWVCFSVAFRTVFQTFLIDSSYNKPIQNMDELFASGIKQYYNPDYNFIFEDGDETEILKIQRNRVSCHSLSECYSWAVYHRNISLFISDLEFEILNKDSYSLSTSTEPSMYKLENGVVYNEGLRMVMLNGDPLLRRVSEIIDRLVEGGFYNYWMSLENHKYNSQTQIIAIVQPLDICYSFNLYHMRAVFFLLLIGWCLSSLHFIFELLYNRLLCKRKRSL